MSNIRNNDSARVRHRHLVAVSHKSIWSRCFCRSAGVRPLTGASYLLRVLIALVVLNLATAVPTMAESNDGTVSGQVINQTAGGGSTAGVSVILVSFGHKEQAPLGQLTNQADTNGRYRFTGLDRDPNIVYITVARYQNVTYPSDQPFQLQNQAAALPDISVYDATTTDDAIQLESLNLLVMGADQGTVQLMEMGALINNADRTFVSTNPQDQALARAIKFALPNGALRVQMQTGFSDKDVIPGVGGVQVTSPIPPGRHQFAMSFQLPYNGSSADLSMQLPYPTGSYSVYLPDSGIKLEGSRLTACGVTQLGGQSYSLYSSTNLPKSTLVGGQLSGLSPTGAPGPNELALISLGVVLFLVGGGVILFGARTRSAVPHTQVRGADTEQERLDLVVRLAALDERFAAGEISQSDYAAERDRGKQRLRELTVARRQATPSGV